MIAAYKIADRIGVDDHKWRPTYQVAKPDGRARVEFYFPELTTREAGSLVKLPLRGRVG